MKKIRLFSAKATKVVEEAEAELYVDFYLALNRNYIFTFVIEAPNLMCSDRHPIRLWKHFLMMLEEENVKYMRRYENTISKKVQGITREGEEALNIWEHSVIEVLTSNEMGAWLHRREKRVIDEILNKIKAEIESQREEVSKKHSEKDELQTFYFGLNDGLKDARDIIDKYKAESEAKEE